MEIVLAKGEYIGIKRDLSPPYYIEKYYDEGRTTVPLKYPLSLSVFLILAGTGAVWIPTKKKKEVSSVAEQHEPSPQGILPRRGRGHDADLPNPKSDRFEVDSTDGLPPEIAQSCGDNGTTPNVPQGGGGRSGGFAETYNLNKHVLCLVIGIGLTVFVHGIDLSRLIIYFVLLSIIAIIVAAARRDVRTFWFPALALLFLISGIFDVIGIALIQLTMRP